MTPDELHQLIRRRITAKNGNMDAALEELSLELAAGEQLRGCWAVLGAWWLHAAYKQMTAARVNRPDLPLPGFVLVPAGANQAATPAPEEGGPGTSMRRAYGPSLRGTSWREKVDPLQVSMPVGNTGVRKPLGDFTREDVLQVRESYLGRARAAEETAEAWHRIAQRMGEGDTLRHVAEREDLVRLGVAKEERHLVPAEA